MKIQVEIDGKLQTVDVPDDSTPQEIDEIVNASPAPEVPGVGSKILYGLKKAGDAMDKVAGAPARAGIRYGMSKLADATEGTDLTKGRTYDELSKPFSGEEMEGTFGKTGGKIVAEAGNVAADVSNVIPFDAVGKLATTVGMKGVKAGTSLLKSGAKIKDVTAIKSGRNVMEGAQKIVDDIAKYGVQSTKGGFEGIAKNARKKIDAALSAADDAVQKAAQAAPDTKVDVDEVFTNFMDELQQGKVASVFGWEYAGAEMAGNIQKALELRGLAGAQPISKLPEIKKAINNGMQLFKKGAQHVADETKLNQIGDLSYLKMKEALESVVPEVAKYNKEAHELINVENAAQEAVKRIGNRDKIGLTDWMLLLGGPTAGGVAGHMGAGTVAGATGAGLILKKALSGGRGASALVSLGKAAKKVAKPADVAAKVGYGIGKPSSVLNRLMSKRKEEEDK